LFLDGLPLYAMLKKPTAQTAHLVFADTQANAEKPKEPIFLPTLGQKQSINIDKMIKDNK